MKITNVRKAIAAALAAGGLCVPARSLAAPLNVNLVDDPSFEMVDSSQVGPFGSLRLTNWGDSSGDNDDNWAFAYSQNYSGVTPPPDADLYHYSGGFNTQPDVGDIFQYVDVSGDESGAAIANGTARYNLSAYFSTYTTQDDSSFVRIRFLDDTLNELGVSDAAGGLAFVASLGTQPGPFGEQRDWGQDAVSGPIPLNTAVLLVEVGSADSDTNHDGYVDLVDVRISAVPEPSTLLLMGLAGAPLLVGLWRKRRTAGS